MWSYKAWRRRAVLKRVHVAEDVWREAYAALPLLGRLSADENRRLRELAILFLHEKSLEGARGLVLTDVMGLVIALQACLPILHLGLDWYSGWAAVIVYPYPFFSEHEHVEAAGVVCRTRRALSGESWLQGPVIVSWPDVEDAGLIDGRNLIIHEFAHKLDMLNGSANGFPPLHRGMRAQIWTAVFSRAFGDFRARIGRGEASVIDPYGAEEPAEFFAVLSEIYFETPDVLRRVYPEVYRQLDAFYRPDPPLLRD